MTSQPHSESSDVVGFLHLIETLGQAAQMIFGRIYQGLGSRRPPPEPPTPAGSGSPDSPPEDPASILRSMNRDLSARVRASELLSTRLKAVFASLSEGIVMQDAEGRIVLINKSAEVLLGSIKNFWDSELGRLFNSAHTYPTTAVVSYSEREEGRTVTEMELIGVPLKVAVNNKVIGAQLALVSSVDGERLGTVIVLRDVTEEALAARLKDEFVTAITHELRTPLTAIKGMSEVLMSQPPDRPPNRKFLEAIGRNAAILDRMIIELLDISEMSAGNFAVHQKRIALDEVALDVIKSQEGRIKKQGIRVGVMVINRSRVYAIGDDQRLRWAVGHLLDNALHYTLKGGLITIRIGVVKADRVQLEVVDSGVGIADKDLPHIFDRFYRGEARTPEGKVIDPRGLGQGLYVARAVAEAHQGYLTVRSKVGEGSTFTLGLPLAPATD